MTGFGVQEQIQPRQPSATQMFPVVTEQSNSSASNAHPSDEGLAQVQKINETVSQILESDRTEVPKPMRIHNQVPIMHSPGEIVQVANMFDPRIFDDGNGLSQDPNIEFHIHAFLSPNGPNTAATGSQQQQRQQHEVGVGPDGGQASVGTSPMQPRRPTGMTNTETQTERDSPYAQNRHAFLNTGLNDRMEDAEMGDQIDSSQFKTRTQEGSSLVEQTEGQPESHPRSSNIFSKPSMLGTQKGKSPPRA